MKNQNPWIHYGILTLIYTVGAITLLTHTVFHSLLHNHGTGIVYAAQPCSHIGQTQTILIHGDAFVPDNLLVNRCDIVVFENKDKNALYLPAFGDHPHDIIYAGFNQKVLGYTQKESFVAHTAGKFLFHDHLKDQIEGTLVVK